MHTGTGEIVSKDFVQSLPTQERGHYVEIKRDVTKHERAAMQIALYSPCGCGSGKKFKFCCHRS